MRTYTSGTTTINYPDAVLQAFNPQYVEITSEYTGYVTVSVQNQSETRLIKCALYNGGAKVFVSRIIQLCFSSGEYYKSLGITIMFNGGAPFYAFRFTAVWGIRKISDSWLFGGRCYRGTDGKPYIEHRATYFKGFPFTINMFLLNSSESAVMHYGSGSDTDTITGTGLVEKTPSVFDLYDLDSGHYDLTWATTRFTDLSGLINSMFGSDEFIMALYQAISTEGEVIERMSIDVKNEHIGYYLRWIDHFGMKRYYLFRKGSITEKTEESDYTINAEQETTGEYYQNQTRVSAKTSQDTIKACAVQLDAETIAYIRDIVTSPEVDMYLGENENADAMWQPVTIVTGNYAYQPESNKILQSYEIQFKLPRYEAQHL